MLARNIRNLAILAKASAKTQKLATPMIQSFSTSLENVTKIKSKLAKALDKELKYETNNYTLDESAEETLKQSGFQIVDNDKSTSMDLVKIAGENTITINFSAKAPENQDQPEQQEEQEQEEEEQDYQDYCDFTVLIQKKHESSTMVYDCSTVNGEININFVTIVSDIEAFKKCSKVDRYTSYYMGPDFSTLDERLQVALTEYLRNFGLTDELIALVEHFASDKEQRLYMGWLKDCSKFLAE